MNDSERLAYIELMNNWLNKPEIDGKSIDDIILIIYKVAFPTTTPDIIGAEPSNHYVQWVADEMIKYFDTSYYDYNTWKEIIYPLVQNAILYNAFSRKL
jgi:hypothetical protein